MPVLMMHGNLESPDTYLKHGNSSPAFILAQNGFDVWLGSSRGSKYSRKHEWLDPDRDQEDYWDFSWEEMGKYDLPAFIDFITNITQYEKIGYIGFSQGTGQMYFAMSGGCDQDREMMEYFRSKISVYISMGTTLKFYNNYSPVMNLGYYIYDIIEYAFDYFSIRELKGGSKDSLNTNFCLKFNGLCQYGAALFADSVIGYNDYDAMRINSMRYPSSTSVKSILHPIQLTRVYRWQCFDYGSDKNIRIYNATHPPEIKINLIRDIPIALFNGRFDRLVGAQDYQWLKEQLNHTIVFDREYDFGHSSFTMAKNMTFFTQDVVDILLLLLGISQFTFCLGELADSNREFKDIVLTRQLAFQDHKVVTEDGYILALHRIPGTLQDLNPKRGPPVLLVHGIMDSADCWVSNDDLSPAFVLSRAGYDVWLLNLRGNKKSKKHVSLAIESDEFWNFSWEENGLYDIPSTIEYILEKTEYEKIAYIGHSMGTTSAFFAMSLNPEYYKQKLNLMVALAPPLSMQNIQSPAYKLFGIDPNAYFVYEAMKLLKLNELFPANWVNQGFFSLVCSKVPAFCKLGDYLLADYDPSLNADAATQVYFSHYPSGESLKQLWHFAQCCQKSKFQRYDYGKLTNMLHYQQETPPEVDLKKIKDIPIVMIAGFKDHLSTIDDTRWAKEQLSQSLVYYGEYELGHLSYMIAKDMSYFKDVMWMMSKYHPIDTI